MLFLLNKQVMLIVLSYFQIIARLQPNFQVKKIEAKLYSMLEDIYGNVFPIFSVLL